MAAESSREDSSQWPSALTLPPAVNGSLCPKSDYRTAENITGQLFPLSIFQKGGGSLPTTGVPQKDLTQ